MPRKRIYSEPLTDAEKQARHREKHAIDTQDSLDRRMDKARKEFHALIDDLNERELFAYKPIVLYLHKATLALNDKELDKLAVELNGVDIFKDI